jgi:CheY-like chemotaxis protein
MQNFNCLVLEDSISDQLSIEMVLCHFPQIEPVFIQKPQEFLNEIAHNTYNLIIVDINLECSVTGLDLIRTLKNTGIWLIICSAHDLQYYLDEYQALPHTKFHIQKPIDESIFKHYLHSFLWAKNNP